MTAKKIRLKNKTEARFVYGVGKVDQLGRQIAEKMFKKRFPASPYERFAARHDKRKRLRI